MRVVLLLITALVLTAGVLWWVNSREDGPEVLEIAPPTPEGVGDAATPAGRAKVVIPVLVSFDELTRLANLAPRRERGQANDPVTSKNVVDDELVWDLMRRAIDVHGSGEVVEITTEVSGVVQGRGKVQATGGVGRLLGALNLDAAPFSAQVDVTADIVVTGQPDLRPDWTIAPNVTANVTLAQAELPIGRLGALDVRKYLAPRLETAVAKQVDAVVARLSDPEILRKPVGDLWQSLCSVQPVTGKDEKIWLSTTPVRVGATSPVVTGGHVEIGLMVEVDVMALSGEAAPFAPACPDLPEALTVLPGGAAAELDVALPVLGRWSWVEAELARSLERPMEEDAGTFVLSAPSVRAYDADEVLVGVDLAFSSRSMLLPDLSGRVWVIMAPVLDRQARVLRFENIRLTSETEGAFARLKSWSADRVLGVFVGRDLSVDLAKLEADAAERGAAQIRAMAENLGRETQAKAALNDVALSEVGITQEGLSFLIRGQGGVAIEDLRLDLGPRP